MIVNKNNDDDDNDNNNNNNIVNSDNVNEQNCDNLKSPFSPNENNTSPLQGRRVSMSNLPPNNVTSSTRPSTQRNETSTGCTSGNQSFIPPPIAITTKKSPGRRWLSTLKLSVWVTTVFTLVFSFFYFFLHVLLLVRVWDPVHEQTPNTNQIIAEISRELARGRIGNEDEEETTYGPLPPLNYEHSDDHRHSREKSIMSMTLILVLSLHSISFYLFSTTLATCIRTIDQFVLRSPPPHDALDNLSIETLYYRLSGHHPPQAFEPRSRARSRMDEEMGVSKRKRRSLMISFFGLVLALLSLLVLVMVQLVFCIALYSPFMDLMDCLLLIFSCIIMCCSIGFIFAASYFHRKTLYY